MRPGRAAEPQKGLVLPVGACRRLCDNLLVNLQVALVKACVLLHNRIEGSEQIHVLKFTLFRHGSAPFQIL